MKSFITGLDSIGWGHRLCDKIPKFYSNDNAKAAESEGRTNRATCLRALHNLAKTICKMNTQLKDPSTDNKEIPDLFVELQKNTSTAFENFIKLRQATRKKSLIALSKYARATADAFKDLIGEVGGSKGLIGIANSLNGVEL